MKRNSSLAFREPDEDVVETLISSLEKSDHLLKRKCGCNPYKNFSRAGPFILGLQLSEATQSCDIDNYVGRKMDDPDPDRYYTLKIAVLPKDQQNETDEQRQTKMFLFNEYSVLSLLKKDPGIIQAEGLYQDYSYESSNRTEIDSTDDRTIPKCEKCIRFINDGVPWQTLERDSNGRPGVPSELDHHYLDCEYLNRYGTFSRRIILALDCHVPHLFCPVTPIIPGLTKKFDKMNSEYENLQDYVKRNKQILEMRALKIMAEVVDVIGELHRKNIAHRDLRLENILYNHRNEKVMIINFGKARYVINDTTCINDHRGSSAYISPDVLKKRPYPPKASDCWALGVILYTMIFGKFPFHADNLSDLFKKINSGNFRIPLNAYIYHGPPYYRQGKMYHSDPNAILISSDTMTLIRSLLVTEASKRVTIEKLKKTIRNFVDAENRFLLQKKSKKCPNNDIQVVPNIDENINEQNPGTAGRKTENRNTKFSNLMHDHNYSQKNHSGNNKESNTVETNDDRKITANTSNVGKTDNQTDDDEPFCEFDAYLTSSRHIAWRSFSPMSYRFLDDYPGSIYASVPQFTPSLIEQELIQYNVSRNDFSMGIRSISSPSSSSNISGTRNRFTVITVDSDIRTLNEQEIHLVNKHLQQREQQFST